MYIRQLSVFPFEETLKFDCYDRLVLTLDSLDFEPVIKQLTKKRGKGRNDYPIRTMLYCLVGGVINRCTTVRELLEELYKNPGFRYLCGIDHFDQIPTEWAFSRFIKKLSEPKAAEALESVFTDAVAKLSQILPDFGFTAAIDATHIEAFSKGTVKKPSDEDAKWGIKKDARGNWFHWFGYKLHLLVDSKYELPIAFTVTSANENDGKQLIPLLSKVSEQQPEIVVKTVLADSIYDPKENYQFCYQQDIALLTPLNQRNRKEEDLGFGQNQQPLGTCNKPLTFVGYDNGYLKYRCPAKTGHGKCPFGGEGDFCSSSSYGLVLKYSVKSDPRKFCRVPRHTDRFRRLYKKRTSVERVYSRLKDHLVLDNLTHRGKDKVGVHILFSLLTMVASALGMAKKDRLTEIRKVTSLVA